MNEPIREVGLERLTANISKGNQHYIVYHFLHQDIRYAASKYASGSLLDIGCGNKPYQNFFTDLDAYVGCDVVQSSERVVDRICPANQLVFEDCSFDTVFSTQVMEHVADFRGMIAETQRVLKPDGIAIYTVPFCWELHEEPYDFYRFTKHGLKDAFQQAGFEILELKSNGGKWATLFQIGLNVMFSTRRYRTWRSRVISMFFIKLRFVYLYNRFAIWLDKNFKDDILTLNYIVVAKKNSR